MVSETGSIGNSASTGVSVGTDQSAARLAAEARVDGAFDAGALATRLTGLGGGDPGATRTLTSQVEAHLTPVERGELARAMDAANDNAAPANAKAPDPATLALDLGQMVLDITGIVDPTPVSDGLNGVISLGRSIGSAFSGEWGDAGGHLANAGISAAGIAVGVGDLAKVGKIGKWAQTVSDSVSAIAHNPALRETLEPALRGVRQAIDSIPQSALDALPASARESIDATKRQLDDFYAAPAKPAQAAQAGIHTAKIGANTAEWTLDANGRPQKVSATLSELQPTGTPRGRDELNAQDRVRELGIDEDDAGHVIGHRFMGDQGERNMFPQNFNFNRSAYKTLENEWAAWIDKGGTVKVDVELIGGTSNRRDQVGVSYEVFNADGKRVFDNQELFDNAAGQTFDRVPTGDMDRMLNP